MVGHQHIGMYQAFRALCIFSQPAKVELIIFIRKETRLFVITPLNNVKRDTGGYDSRSSRHKANSNSIVLENQGKPWSVPGFFDQSYPVHKKITTLPMTEIPTLPKQLAQLVSG